MKKKLPLIFFSLFTVWYVHIPIVLSAEEYLRAEFMSPVKAEKKWGIASFDAEKFRTAEVKTKASMAVDIVKRQVFLNETLEKVEQTLGKPDGYFFSDSIFAYQIQRYHESTREAWQLVFIPDKDLKKVKEIKIHKKCCYEKLPPR